MFFNWSCCEGAFPSTEESVKSDKIKIALQMETPSLLLFNALKSDHPTVVTLDTIHPVLGQGLLAVGTFLDALAVLLFVATALFPEQLPYIQLIPQNVLLITAGILFLLGSVIQMSGAFLLQLRQLYRFDLNSQTLHYQSRLKQGLGMPSSISFEEIQGFTLKQLLRPNGTTRFWFLELNLHSGKSYFLTAFKSSQKARQITETICARTLFPYEEQVLEKVSLQDLKRPQQLP